MHQAGFFIIVSQCFHGCRKFLTQKVKFCPVRYVNIFKGYVDCYGASKSLCVMTEICVLTNVSFLNVSFFKHLITGDVVYLL